MKRVITKKRTGKSAAFTLVELLTTLTVIGVLLALLIPALNQVSKTAVRVKQKAQFHAIGTALEAFRNDYGDYPPSAYSGWVTDIATASHNLAEALVGRDGLGFHRASQFRGGGLADIDGDGTLDVIYGDPAGYTAETPADNLAARRGPYLEVESANAVLLGNIIPPLGTPELDRGLLAYVLVDMFKINKNAATGKEVGMPILYYRAHKMRIGNNPDPAFWYANTYNINDSYCSDGSAAYGFIENSWGTGLFSDDEAVNAAWFYSTIQNPNFPGPPARPYRAESFLLHSAGPDGLYGTTDDMFNFDQDN